ncbi:protection of telomeres protein 1 isoform X2 [Trematomus bernacchii]|uniref:protection of telomeres protein 1 isoform X2 n=1 Tax=Trematomus bernacchii TaxID=40690 RepID=UPI00146C6EB6|nr:protection of telomeres protein 1 isoform X2 [Trematomus bernacchii]
MPVHVLSEGAGPGAQVPKHLSCVSIALISTSTNFSDKTVKGKVLRKCPLVSSASGDFILKIIIQEEVSPPDASPQNPSINVILFGAIAKDFDGAVNQGDVVVAAGFTVGKSPTVQKDKLHPFNLLLRGDSACIYVSPPPPPVSRSSPAAKRISSLSAEVSRKTKVPKYTYVGLGDLTAGSVVNVYGVVVFFKQPFKTRGTDFCSSLKITDQSNEKISCSIFCEKLEDHPKIYQIGDIVRLHRVKVQLFNSSMTLVKTFGFSVMAFDGAVGGSMEPRTSSRSFSFDQEDRKRVEELRSWASDQSLLPPSPTMPLCDVQPKAYFDLTCQLLAKAPIDSTCTLLRVWDGTRSAHTLLKVIVEPDATEGPSSFPPERERLIANILAYDNHVEYARQLKPGEFLRIYNLRAIPGSSKVPGLTSSQKELDHLAFHLHGGNAFGRGIRVLPEDCPDVQEMKRVMEACPEDDEDDFSALNDSELMEIWSTPPESIDAETSESINTDCSSSTERRCDHDTHSVSLSEVKRSGPAGVHHVRVQLKSYEPQKLHQSLKLYCSKCSTLQEVPDDEMLAGLFSEASRDSGPFSPPDWAVSGQVDVPGNPPGSKTRTLGVHLSTEFMYKQLLFLMGSSLEETCVLSSGYQNIVPVRSSGGQLTLLHPSAPFLFRGTRTYYGCERCSEAAVREPVCAGGGRILDEKIIAEALGVVPLRFVLLMKLELRDVSDSLHVFLWRSAEEFFGVSAEDAAANQEAQDIISQSMDSLCPAGGSTAERPWMDLCLTKYQSVDDDGLNQICYQISHSTFTRPSAPPNPTVSASQR